MGNYSNADYLERLEQHKNKKRYSPEYKRNREELIAKLKLLDNPSYYRASKSKKKLKLAQAMSKDLRGFLA